MVDHMKQRLDQRLGEGISITTPMKMLKLLPISTPVSTPTTGSTLTPTPKPI